MRPLQPACEAGSIALSLPEVVAPGTGNTLQSRFWSARVSVLSVLRLTNDAQDVVEEPIAALGAERAGLLRLLNGKCVVIRAVLLADPAASELLDFCWDAGATSVSLVVRSPSQLVRVCAQVRSQALNRPLNVILSELEPVRDLLCAAAREQLFPPYLSLTMRELLARWSGDTAGRCLRVILASGFNITGTDLLAKNANMGRATLFRKLRAERIASPKRLVDACRIAGAAVLIRCGAYAEIDIARALGYSSQHELDCLFRLTGTTRQDLSSPVTRWTQTIGLLDDVLPRLDRLVRT